VKQRTHFVNAASLQPSVRDLNISDETLSCLNEIRYKIFNKKSSKLEFRENRPSVMFYVMA